MMGECHCSKIAVMQLFHELKQQFPALPDHVVSQCIVQNSYDRETCARSLRAVQESRPPPGAFPPPPPQPDLLPDDLPPDAVSLAMEPSTAPPSRSEPPSPGSHRASRPASLDVAGAGRRHSDSQPRQLCPTFGRDIVEEEVGATCAELSPGFKLNLNVARQPPGSSDYASVSPPSGLTPSDSEPRSITSVSLTLRPPSSEPQPPIDVSSQGSNLTYLSSQMDPRGYQSRLQISIGHGSGAGARVKPPPVPQRTNSLTTVSCNLSPASSPSGLPVSPMPRSTTTVSAPTTPSGSAQSGPSPPSSLPATPLDAPATNLGAIPRTKKPKPKPRTKHATHLEPKPEPQLEPDSTPVETQSPPEFGEPQQQPQYPEEYREFLEQIPDEYKSLIFEHLFKKDQMAKAVDESERELESLKKEIEMLSDPETSTALKDYERELRSQIYQLQLECERLAEEVDSHSDSQIPLGETDEEFYKSIYTGQEFDIPETETRVPPPLPPEPPAWEPVPSAIQDPDDADGPSWVCPKCTFANHPLLNKCEECDTPRVLERAQGETQDIHIRVTHHHNFSPQCTVHNWVV